MPDYQHFTCEDFFRRLDDFLEGRMPPVERRVAEQHLAGCTQCSVLVDAVRASLQTLGEERAVLTAPVRDSVEGTITYNTPSLYLGTTYENLSFTFEGGRIVKATGDPLDRLEQVLDTDEGARYIGEFSLGFNPYVMTPMKDTLFDEKIAGSLHFTPGQAYTQADNGNRSQIHWDLVLIQRPEYGGGEIWFDGELVRRDGRFVVPDLEGLNPERLTS